MMANLLLMLQIVLYWWVGKSINTELVQNKRSE
jgi:hypothetical protein